MDNNITIKEERISLVARNEDGLAVGILFFIIHNFF